MRDGNEREGAITKGVPVYIIRGSLYGTYVHRRFVVWMRGEIRAALWGPSYL